MSESHNYEAWYIEHPNLLFGSVLGVSVFNATKYMEAKNVDPKTHNVEDFQVKCADVIRAYATNIGCSVDDMFFLDSNSDSVILADLCFAFVSYVDPNFAIAMHNYVHDIYSSGFVLSEMSIIKLAKTRLPTEILKGLSQ